MLDDRWEWAAPPTALRPALLIPPLTGLALAPVFLALSLGLFGLGGPRFKCCLVPVPVLPNQLRALFIA